MAAENINKPADRFGAATPANASPGREPASRGIAGGFATVIGTVAVNAIAANLK